MLGDLGKLIVAKGFKKLLKVQKIARSGHTAQDPKIYFATSANGAMFVHYLTSGSTYKLGHDC